MRHAFDAALAAVEMRADEDPPAAPRFVSSLPVAEEQVFSGRHSLWDMAAEWTPEADPPRPRPAAPPKPPPSAAPQDIALELGLAALRSRPDIVQARRRFMWDNHPDRRPDLDRALANRRVAIANMLLDRALLDLARKALR